MLCVFVCHFTRSLEAAGVGFDFKILPDTVFSVYLGSFGVTLFFIVSGAALMYVYEEKIDIKTYIIKRLKGLYPLLRMTYLFAFFITFYERGFQRQELYIVFLAVTEICSGLGRIFIWSVNGS